MNYLEIAPLKLVRKDKYYFTYHNNHLLVVGSLVRIPIGKTSCIGIVIGEAKKPNFNTRPIEKVIYKTPIPEELIKTAKWMSNYYNVHLALCLSLLIPAGIEKTRRKYLLTKYNPVRVHKKYSLTKDQANAIKKISDSQHTTNILFGITGSGKTNVYIEIAKLNFEQGLSSIILVPEISLTSQIIDDFMQEFKDHIIVTHSRQTESERHLSWKKALESNTPKIIIGPRSALFLPIKKIGAIIVDEFHEPSYKQDKQPKYSTLRVATMLCNYHNAKAIFGSATPPVVEMYIAKKSSSPIVKMSTTALNVTKPKLTVVDMTKRVNFLKHRFISDALISTINKALSKNNQVLLFHNRRGTSPITLCGNCGWIAVDPVNDTPLTLHTDKHLLISHITGYSQKVPTCCPICNNVDIIHKGIGTKLLESELKKLYPNATIARFDGDNKKGESLYERYQELYNGKIDIIIGTQVVAKGIDLPKLNTVGVVQADTNLSLPDYTSEERVFQLLSQVIGRVGRHGNDSEVVIQSYQPNSIAIKTGIKQNYDEFYNYTLSQRKKNYLPPFTFLLRITCTYKTEAAAIKNSTKLLQILKLESSNKKISFFGPAPAFYEKQNNSYRWQIIAKSPKRYELLDLISKIPQQYWQYEIDPISLL